MEELIIVNINQISSLRASRANLYVGFFAPRKERKDKNTQKTQRRKHTESFCGLRVESFSHQEIL